MDGRTVWWIPNRPCTKKSISLAVYQSNFRQTLCSSLRWIRMKLLVFLIQPFVILHSLPTRLQLRPLCSSFLRFLQAGLWTPPFRPSPGCSPFLISSPWLLCDEALSHPLFPSGDLWSHWVARSSLSRSLPASSFLQPVLPSLTQFLSLPPTLSMSSSSNQSVFRLPTLSFSSSQSLLLLLLLLSLYFSPYFSLSICVFPQRSSPCHSSHSLLVFLPKHGLFLPLFVPPTQGSLYVHMNTITPLSDFKNVQIFGYNLRY